MKLRKETDKMNKKIWKIAGLILLVAMLCSACADTELLLDEEDYVQADELAEETDIIALETGNATMASVSGTYETIWVHVCGAVTTPGVYELPQGSRINDAVLSAGGFDEEADREIVNLVEEIADGQQVRIPFIGEGQVNAGSGLIDLNSADAEQLCQIPGIGESRAEAIIKYRDAKGGFDSPEELMQVPGIKEGIYARVSPYIECR